MKYFYGNSFKELMDNKPVEIESEEVLQQYKDNYSIVMPAHSNNRSDLDYDLALDSNDYRFDEDDFLVVSKDILDEFVQDEIVTILFADQTDALFDYQMISEDSKYIYLEYVSD